MSTFSRLLALLIGLAVAGCAFLPWVGGLSAWNLHLRSLLSAGDNLGVGVATSVGLAVCVAAGLIAAGCLLNSRAILIVGGLAAVAVPTIWILVNAISRSTTAVPLSRIEIGAYGAAIGGFMILILSAVALDTRTPTLR